MIAEKNKKFLISLEIAFISLLIWIVNHSFPDYYGFWSIPFNPYAAAAVLISVYYGRIYGYISFGISFALLMIPYSRGVPYLDYLNELFFGHMEYLAAVIVVIYVFGIINRYFVSVIENQRVFMRKIAKEKIRLKNELKGIEAVNREFEERVLLQSDSITALYNQISALHSQNLTKSLNILLSTVQEFTLAEKISIWEYQKESNSLVMIANMGWTIDDAAYSIESVESTISGWVFRNNKIFSVRMLLENETLRKMDIKRNILTYPINLSNTRWGVLNIESMPFSKFNLYTERILSILVDLAGPAIERAVEYEAIIKHADINTYTQLPSPSQFMITINKEIKRSLEKGKVFSVILMEITSLDEIIHKYGEKKTYQLVLRLFDRINEAAENKIDFFHYKKMNQFALLYPDTDYDGAAYLCYESLGIIRSTEWRIDNNIVNIEVVFGYSALGSSEIDAEELLESAHQLLEMQKV